MPPRSCCGFHSSLQFELYTHGKPHEVLVALLVPARLLRSKIVFPHPNLQAFPNTTTNKDQISTRKCPVYQ